MPKYFIFIFLLLFSCKSSFASHLASSFMSEYRKLTDTKYNDINKIICETIELHEELHLNSNKCNVLLQNVNKKHISSYIEKYILPNYSEKYLLNWTNFISNNSGYTEILKAKYSFEKQKATISLTDSFKLNYSYEIINTLKIAENQYNLILYINSLIEKNMNIDKEKPSYADAFKANRNERLKDIYNVIIPSYYNEINKKSINQLKTDIVFLGSEYGLKLNDFDNETNKILIFYAIKELKEKTKKLK